MEDKRYKKLAPIALFTYNRPELVGQTLKSLKKCQLSDESELYIFSDGNKKNSGKEDFDKINKVREIVRSDKWCKAVEIIERKENFGLRRSIIDGIDYVLEKHDRIIVLEDDLLLSPGFLEYMNNALEMYYDNEKVMHVSGYIFPFGKDLPETFFLRLATCSGWATWKRAWNKLEKDPDKVYRRLKEKGLLERFNQHGRSDFAMQLVLNQKGILDTWAIKWYAAIFLNDGLSLHPGKTLVNHIGFVKGGSNTDERHAEMFVHEDIADKIEISEISLDVNEPALEAYKALRTAYMPLVLRPFYFTYTQNPFSRFVLNSLFLMKRKFKL